MSETNPYVAGVFYTGSFVTSQFVPSFSTLLADKRLAILLEIEAKPSVSIIPLARWQPSQVTYNLNLVYFYFLDALGVFNRTTGAPAAFIDIDVTYAISPPAPGYLIFADENGDPRYVTVNSSTLDWQASGTIPSQFTTADGHFCGEYLEVVDAIGTGIWHITVNSSNVISTTKQATETKRINPIRLSHGHPSPIDSSNNLWSPALISLGDMRNNIPQVNGGYAGIATPSFTEFQIEAATSEYQYLTEQSWDTRTVTIRAGLTTDPIDDFSVILRGQTSKCEMSINTMTITMRDSGVLFRKSFQENIYGGSGGYDGSTSMEGVVKPLAYGQLNMAPPVLIDETLNLYQVHDGPIHAFYDVYTGAALLTSYGDLAGLADLTEWSPTQGEVDAGAYRTDIANGIFRLAARPTNPITVNFAGSTSVQEFDFSIGDILQAVITTKLPEVTLDVNAISSFISRWPRTYGRLYVTQEMSIGEALNDILEPMGAVAVLTRLNTLRIMMLERGSARAYITSDSIVESPRSPVRREPPTPGLNYRVGMSKLVQLNDTDILENADDDARQLAIGPVQFSSYSPWSSASKRYESAGNVEVVGNVGSASYTREKILYSMVHRDYFLQSLYEITVMGYLYQFELGDTVLIEIPELGINQPKTAIIIGITERSPTTTSEDQTDLLLWTH